MPIVRVGDTSYRVQFVHSAHDLKNSRGYDNPGGVRQFVDNLASSLRRRVSFAEVSRIEEVRASKRSAPETSYVPLAQGFAVCHHTDQFEKEYGRNQALVRALKLSRLPRDVQDGISIEVTGLSLEELKKLYNKTGLVADVVCACPIV